MREGGRERSCRKNSFKPLAAKLISLLKFLAVHKQNLIVMLLMEHTSKRTHIQTQANTHTDAYRGISLSLIQRVHICNCCPMCHNSILYLHFIFAILRLWLRFLLYSCIEILFGALFLLLSEINVCAEGAQKVHTKPVCPSVCLESSCRYPVNEWRSIDERMWICFSFLSQMNLCANLC